MELKPEVLLLFCCVQVEDTSFPSAQYERVEGESKTQWTKLGAGANESMTFVVRPKTSGVLSAGPALITYVYKPPALGLHKILGRVCVQKTIHHCVLIVLRIGW